MSVSVIALVMVKLFLILILGYILEKTGILDDHANRKISTLIANVTSPLLVLASVLTASKDGRSSVFVILAAGFLMYVGFILIGKIVVKVFRVNAIDKPAVECMMMFANVSFMGYPVLQSVLGDEAIFYCTMMHFAFNILVYTYGVNCFKQNKDGEKSSLKDALQKCVNPGFIINMLALLVYVTGFRMNGIVYDTVYMVGNITSPLSMIILGSTMALFPLKESLCQKKSYIFAVIRLLVIPTIICGICRLTGVNEYFTGIATISTGMPVAAMVLILANQYESPSRKLVVSNILITTALSVVTIPLLVAFLL
ncbi:MAG: AEC family transporter [Lachnospiraceae bacterium]|nr:AEC family transporter [Lachnospiraceae bacterium]